jgi:hypothetical protein
LAKDVGVAVVQISLVVDRDIRTFFGPPCGTVRKWPTFAERLAKPALYEAADFFTVDFGYDVTQ